MGGPGSGRRPGGSKKMSYGRRSEILRANYNTAISHSKGMGANKLAFKNAATKNKSAVAKMKRKGLG
jgi:hypothetical protein